MEKKEKGKLYIRPAMDEVEVKIDGHLLDTSNPGGEIIESWD